MTANVHRLPTPAATPMASATPFSTPAFTAASIEAAIPAWVELGALDAEVFYAPAPPATAIGAAGALADAVIAHRSALTPAEHQQRTDILGELRLRTVPREEGRDEAVARFRLLRDDLADVPADILRDSCSAYVNNPGTRFFPAAAGELRTFINPLIARRRMRTYRLDQMRKAAEEIDRRADFLAEDSIKPGEVEEVNALMAKIGSSLRYQPDGRAYWKARPEEARAEEKRTAGPPRTPTAADYAALLGQVLP